MGHNFSKDEKQKELKATGRVKVANEIMRCE